MNKSRSAIFERLGQVTTEPEIDWEAILPGFVAHAADQTLLLKSKLEAVHTSVDIVETAEQIETSIVRFLEAGQYSLEMAVTPAVDGTQLDPAGRLTYYQCNDYTDCQTALTQAKCGIAETGTVVLPSSVQRPTLANFLPDNCIVLLNEADILPYLENALQRIQFDAGGMPRALNLISGPSKTADIEQTLVYGAHGPIQLHVIILRTNSLVAA